MDASNWIALAAILAGAGITIFSVRQGYRFAIQQDDRRWAREQRAHLYIDLLVEARAEADWALREWTRLEIAEIAVPNSDEYQEHMDRLPDDRMPSRERKELGARMLAYASPEVSRLFNEIGRHAPMLPMTRRIPAVERPRVDQAFANLEKQVRMELRGDAAD